MDVSGVVLAAGRGERLGQGVNKLWASTAGRSLLEHTLRALWGTGLLDELVVVLRPEEGARLPGLIEAVGVPLRGAPGGARRQDSARAGVEAAGGEYVLVHDGARPLVDTRVVRAVLEAARRHGAAVPVLPVVDTMRYVDQAGFLRGDGPVREGLVHVQTPQGFRRGPLLEAYTAAEARGQTLSDDAAAFLGWGQPVATVAGDPANLKVTRPDDLVLVTRLLSTRRDQGCGDQSSSRFS